jgi:hypothetical protein
MSAAVRNLDTRSVATAYGTAAAPRRAWLRLRPPHRRALVLPWRDLLAVARAPSRLLGAVVLALLAAGLVAAAARDRHTALVPVACAMGLGYLAASWLCEGARLDAEDTRRSVPLPFRFKTLAWRHAVVPAGLLLAAGAIPAVVAAAAGAPRFLALLAMAVPVLVGGAMVNVFRGEFPLDMFAGVDTLFGNTAAISIIFWAAWGPLVSVLPLTVLLSAALSARPAGLARLLLLSLALAAALLAYAARRAARLRSA